MAAFMYQGKTMQGQVVKGQMDANSEAEVRVKLRAQRIVPIKIVSKTATSAKPAGFDFNKIFAGPVKVKDKELQIFSRQFATMINSGIPIVQGLDILSQQSTNKGFKEVIVKIKTQLEAGKRLNECLAMHPSIFNKMFVSMIKAGEEGGVLDTILNRLAVYLEKNGKIKGKITGALWYPLGVMIVAAIVIICLLKFVIPKFETMFKNSGQKLPALTQMVVDASHALTEHFVLIMAIIVVVVFLISFFFRTPTGKEAFDKNIIKIPVFGPLILKGAVARFTRTMSTMLGCGVGILDALETCSTVTGNVMVERAIMRIRSSVADGKSIVQPMSQEKLIPFMVTQMVGVGEASGTMDSMFAKIADFYEEEVEYAVEALTSLMEPLMMVMLGSIVATIVIAMYLPIFNMGNLFS